MTRKLIIDICDYNRNVVCSLYDNSSNVSGQAVDVFINTTAAGSKQLTFTLPTSCIGQNGIQENYRLDYLKADYLIRILDDSKQGQDWFIISQPRVVHNAFSKNVSVTAAHLSLLLKNKQLNLQFSDQQKNNVGTARELLQRILDGTDWAPGKVYKFGQKDGRQKYRTLKCSTRTGAYKMISMLCELFDAKPIYHGHNKTVDIVPLNPFSKPQNNQLPDLTDTVADEDGSNEQLLADGCIQLHYGNNIKGVTRSLNTENIVTKLYAYGSYGSKETGYCGIEHCTHAEYSLVLTQDLDDNATYYFTIQDPVDKQKSYTYNFTTSQQKHLWAGSTLVYSFLDPASRSYVWSNEQQQMFPVADGHGGERAVQLPCTVSVEQVENKFSFLMDFDYYRTIGLLSDVMLQKIARYQRQAPNSLDDVAAVSLQLSETKTKLAQTIGSINYCKLAINFPITVDQDTGSPIVQLDNENYKNGVIYRTDYDESEINYFEWNASQKLNVDGDPINTAASMLLVIHSTDPVKWQKSYVREIVYDKQDDKIVRSLKLWNSDISLQPEDQIFLFAYNGIAGKLGSTQAADQAAIMALDDETTIATNKHPVIFYDGINLQQDTSAIGYSGYVWAWDYSGHSDMGNVDVYSDLAIGNSVRKLYFSYLSQGDNRWKPVIFKAKNRTIVTQNNLSELDEPAVVDGAYWYDWRASVLYKQDGGQWVKYTSSAAKKIASYFGVVFMFCCRRDRYYDGLYTKYEWQNDGTQPLAPGNYYFESPYGAYWAFTLNEPVANAGYQIEGCPGDVLSYDTNDGWLTHRKYGYELDENGQRTGNWGVQSEKLINVKSYRFDGVLYHPANVFAAQEMTSGMVDSEGQIDISQQNCRTMGTINVVSDTVYDVEYDESVITQPIYVACYDGQRNYIDYENSDGDSGLIKISHSGSKLPINGQTQYIRIVILNMTAQQFNAAYKANPNLICIKAQKLDTRIIISDMNYEKLEWTNDLYEQNVRKGIIEYIKDFAQLSELAYNVQAKQLAESQGIIKQLNKDMVTALGQLYRQSYWQTSDYVQGDQVKLYDDAYEKIQKMSQPQATYDIQYLSPYSTDFDSQQLGTSYMTISTKWPDFTISTAAHLIDMQIDIDKWAYISKLNKCYDQPWKTSLVLDTNLTRIYRHSFTDVIEQLIGNNNQVGTRIQRAEVISEQKLTQAEVVDLIMKQETIQEDVNAGSDVAEDAHAKAQAAINAANKAQNSVTQLSYTVGNWGSQISKNSDGVASNGSRISGLQNRFKGYNDVQLTCSDGRKYLCIGKP